MVRHFLWVCRRQRGFVTALWWTAIFAAMSFMPCNLLNLYRRFAKGHAMPFGPLIKRKMLNQDDDRPANLAALGTNLILLSFRGSLLQRSNFCMVSEPRDIYTDALHRAACLMEAKIRGADGDKVPQENFRGQPLDMSQFDNSYSTLRVAVSSRYDLLVQKPHSDYCLVSFDGYLYRVVTENDTGKATWPGLMHTLEAIRDDVAQRTDVPPTVGTLTALPRNQWYQERQRLLAHDHNRQTLEAVEGALFFVAIDSQEKVEGAFRWRWVRDHNIGNRWFDFGYQLIVLSDGSVGYPVDHVAADGAAAAGQIQHWLKRADEIAASTPANAQVLRFESLTWSGGDRLKARIASAEEQLTAERVNWYSATFDISGLGSSAFKAGNVSPDAGTQLLCLLAYYKALRRYPQGCVGLAQMRQFHRGRYTFVHSLTREAMRWMHLCAEGHHEDGKATLVETAQSVADCFKGARAGKDFFATLFAMSNFQVYGSLKGNALASSLNLTLGKYLPGVFEVASPELLFSNMSMGGDITYIAGVNMRVDGLSMCYKIFPERISVEIFWNFRKPHQLLRIMEGLDESGELLKEFLGVEEAGV